MVDTTPLPAALERAGTVDFDLHGLVGVRLIDASPADLGAVVAQLGPGTGPLTRPPDLTIRYVDRLATAGPVRFLGRGEAGFTDDAFLVLQGRHKRAVRVQVPMAAVGGACEIVAERGVGRVPLLIAVLNLTVLANGGVALHASAFEQDGRGTVVTGWSKGGKTEALLAHLSRGASYVADEWVHVDPVASTVGGLREPVRVWDWHLAELPELRARTTPAAKARLTALRAASAVDLRRLPVGSRVAHAVESHRFVDLRPERLDPGAGPGLASTSFDRLFLVTSTESAATVAAPVDPAEVADRMAASLAYERSALLSWYSAFRYAFPGERNATLEGAAELERERLRTAFAGVPSYEVTHPYPVALAPLADAMATCAGARP